MLTAEGILGELEQDAQTASQFKGLWASISNKILSIKALGSVFTNHRARYENLQVKAKTSDQRAKVEQGLARTDERISLWKSVNDKITRYMPEWLSASSPVEEHPLTTSYFGVVPIVIGVVAIGALAYVVTYGLRLLKEASTENQILADLERGILTPSEAAKILEKPPLIGLGTLGLLPILLIAGFGVYYFVGTKRG